MDDPVHFGHLIVEWKPPPPNPPMERGRPNPITTATRHIRSQYAGNTHMKIAAPADRTSARHSRARDSLRERGLIRRAA